MYIYMYMLLLLELTFYYLIFKIFHEKKIFVFVKFQISKLIRLRKLIILLLLQF